jgi:hypothetical protein
MLPISAQFAAALSSGTFQPITQLTVWGRSVASEPASYQQLLPTPGNSITIIGGSVTLDTTQPVWRTCQATLADPGRWLVPETLFSPLTPFGNEVRISQGIQYPNGTQELIPMGVYALTAVPPLWSNANVTIPIQGSDRGSTVGLRLLRQPVNIVTGQDLGDTIESLIGGLIPNNGQLNINPLAYNVALEATTLYQGDNPWTDAQSMTQNAGFLLYFDPFGNAQLQPTPNFPSQVPVWPYNVGTGTLLKTAQRTLSQTGPSGPISNDFLTIYEGTSTTYTANPPVQAEASETNPASPFYTGGSYGDVPTFVYTAVLQGTSAATASAQQLLTLNEGEADTLTLTATANPALDAYDVFSVNVPRLYLNGNYFLQGATTPFALGGDQSLTVVAVT